MCPDPKLLSIYMDGELPAPWKEKMEEHLSGCSACREKFNNYKKIQELFKKDTRQSRIIVEKPETESAAEVSQESELAEASLMEASKERVWRKLESRQRFRSYSLLRRRLSIPLPAAAAAAAVVLVLVTVFLVRGRGLQQPDYAARANLILAAEDEMPGFIPASADMNGVLQYLDSDGADIIILRLPESKSFFRSGEPVIRPADYSRSQH